MLAPQWGFGAADRHLRRGGARQPRAGIGDGAFVRRAVRARDRQAAGLAARGRQGQVDSRAVPDPLARRGGSQARRGDRRVLDLRRRARDERLHVHRARRGLDRGGRRGGAVGGRRRVVGAAARRRALARAEDARRRRADGRRRALRQGAAGLGRAADGLRSPRLPRRGPAGAGCCAAPRTTLGSPRVEVAEALEKAALAELEARQPDRVLATNVEFWSAVVLDFADVPPDLFTPLFTCARTAGWSAHILEQKREARLIRPTAKYVGPPPRPLSDLTG